MSLLSVTGLAVDFFMPDGSRIRAVEGVDLEVAQDEIVCLVGESGCGKSVTVRSLFNLLPPPGRRVEGQVVFDGHDLDQAGPERLRTLLGGEVGYVFQDPMTYLNPLITIGGQIAESLAGTTRLGRDAELRGQVVGLLEGLGLGDAERVARSYPHQLSGGMRQRVLIAMAIARRPRLLILDEPTTALDVTIQAQIVDLIRTIQKHTRCGLIFVTHDFGLVAELADRVYVMYAGQLVEQGLVDGIFARPRHPYTKGLIECVIPLGVGADLRTIAGEVPNPRTPPPGCRFRPRCPRADGCCAGERPPWREFQGGRVRCFHPGFEGASPAAEVPAGTFAEKLPPAARRRAASAAPALPGEVSLAGVFKTFPVRSGFFGGRAVVHAVGGVSFCLEPGEIFALVGESGSGKSTLGRLIAGLEEAARGQVLIGGQDPAGRLRRARGKSRPLVQMVFQDPYSSLNPHKTVRHTLAQPLRNFNICPAGEVESRSLRLLELMGLTPAAEYLGRYPHELSGGQRQRVVLARALAAEPRVLVADEPVSSLDMSTRAQILGLLRKLRGDLGLTVILITHDLAVVGAVADRLGVMYLGRLLEVAPVALGLGEPLQPYTQMLISSVPPADPKRSRGRPRFIMSGEPPSPVHLPPGCPLRARCPRALPQCAELRPELRELKPDHQVACHLF